MLEVLKNLFAYKIKTLKNLKCCAKSFIYKIVFENNKLYKQGNLAMLIDSQLS